MEVDARFFCLVSCLVSGEGAQNCELMTPLSGHRTGAGASTVGNISRLTNLQIEGKVPPKHSNQFDHHRCPTSAAARCRLDSVMSCFGSRMRSTWERLVLSNAAMRALEIFFFFMALASCQATTSLIACACASSKMFSFFRKSSTLDPRCFLLIAPTPSGACAPALNRLHAWLAFS